MGLGPGRLVAVTGLVAALDVGGTKVAGALLDGTGICHRVRRSTAGPPGAADPGSHAVRAVADELASRAAAPVLAVGTGWCEYVLDGQLTSNEVLAWSRQPASWLPEVFGVVPVVVESDVRCGLLAEVELGAARGRRSAAFVSWGTGISSALLIEGRLWPGSGGRAIALGELPAAGGHRLESYASGAAMAARWTACAGPTVGPGRVLDAATDGHPGALLIADTAGAALAEAIVALVHLVDPGLVVVGGGLGASDTVARRSLVTRWRELGRPAELVCSALGADGPLLGAALAAGWRPDTAVR